jgi:hypothetical protein
MTPIAGPNGTESDVAAFRDDYTQRSMIERRLGPTRVLCGFPMNIHYNGIGYVIHPFQAWVQEYFQTFDHHPQSRGRWLSNRDRIVWMLWHFRAKALLLTGPLTSKVRFFSSECTNCGRRFSVLKRAEAGKRGCPRCGCRTHKDVTPDVIPKPLGKITKRALRERFKISERRLKRILAAKLVRFWPDNRTEVSSPATADGSIS